MSVWYLARRDELLIDLDEYMRPTKRGGPWGEEYFRLRLQVAIEERKLKVSRVFLVRSTTPRHFHAFVKLAGPISKLKALVWQVHLGSDWYRSKNDLARLADGVPHPSLLIRSEVIADFWRRPDAICMCEEKHKTADQLAMGKNACPVWLKYRGLNPWAIWGPPAEPQRGVALPEGEVPLELILTKNRDKKK